jgi:predicted transcriptional regulator
VTVTVTDYQYVIRLPADLAQQLQQRAEAEDRPLARIVRQAIREYLERSSNGGSVQG